MGSVIRSQQTLLLLADRCVVFSEEHRIVADLPTDQTLVDTSSLTAVNLIHDHTHRHGGIAHAHLHDTTHHAGALETSSSH